MGDHSLLQSVFLNLGINASHAMPNGGRLVFTLANRELDRTDVLHSQFKLAPGRYLKVSVEDSGFGMSAEIQKHIFEPFFTTKSQGKGTGLGLSTVYGAVQSHKGAIKIYSEEGMGSVFNLYFPLIEEDQPGEAVQKNQPIRGTGTILLVDDEDIIRHTGKKMLESLGYQVMTAADGSEGLKIFNDRMDRIDLVILDMIMPVMGGRQTFTHLKRLKPDVKILLASGFLKHEDLPKLQSLGLNGFIRKPFNRLEFSLAVAEALNP
jgi:CheY-like chemotaxis protein